MDKYLSQYILYDLVNIVLDYYYGIDGKFIKKFELKDVTDIAIYNNKIYCIKNTKNIAIYNINGDDEKMINVGKFIDDISCTKNGIYILVHPRKYIYVYSIYSYQLVRRIKLEGDNNDYYGILCVDDKNIIIQSDDIITFSMDGKIERQYLSTHNQWKFSLFSDNTNIYSCNTDNTINIINKNSGKIHNTKILSDISYSNFIIVRNIIIFKSNDRQNIIICDKNTGKFLSQFDLDENGVRRMQIENNNLYILYYSGFLSIFT